MFSDKPVFRLDQRHRKFSKLMATKTRSHDNLSNGKHSFCAEMMKSTNRNGRRGQAARPNDRKPIFDAAQDLLLFDRSSETCPREQPD